MGHGLTPSPYDGPDPDDPIDDGTLHRIGSPTPRPIGLDSKSRGPAKGSGASMAEQIVAWRRGDIVQFRDYRFDRKVVTTKTGETAIVDG